MTALELLAYTGGGLTALLAIYKALDTMAHGFLSHIEAIIERHTAPVGEDAKRALQAQAAIAAEMHKLNVGFDTLTNDVSHLKGWTAGFTAGSRLPKGGPDAGL